MAKTKPDNGNPDRLAALKDILLKDDQERVDALEAEIRSLRGQLADKQLLVERLADILPQVLDLNVRHSRNEIVDILNPIIAEGIRQQTGNNSDDLAETLAPTIRKSIEYQFENSRDRLTEVMAPIINDGIKHQVSTAKEDIVDALYPIMGRMVSRSVAEAMKKLANNINQKMNSTFRFEAWKRRFRARVMGVNPGEAVLAGALPFEVEEVYLISRQSGLLIAHAVNDLHEDHQTDALVIGSMLTAIKSFVEDAFEEGEEHDGVLNEIGHTKQSLNIDTSKYSYLAVVYNGVPGPDFKDKLQAQHHQIHERYYRQLRDYEGDNSALLEVEADLRQFIKKVYSV